MSERSELFSLPDLCVASTGTPEGGDESRSPFFAYFLWRSKESERLPGRPRQRLIEERKIEATYKTKSEQNKNSQ